MNRKLPFRYRLWLGFGHIADGIVLLLCGIHFPKLRQNGLRASKSLARWRGKQMMEGKW